MTLTELMSILRLARTRFDSKERYRLLQSKLAEMSIIDLRKRGVVLANERVLELAAGPGGYSDVLSAESLQFVTSDLDRHPGLSSAHTFIRIDVTERFPLADQSFDFVYCSSLIEHIDHPANMLSECIRVLKPGGRMLLSFPPFWSVFMIGGHGFKPWHLLGESVSLRLHRVLKHRSIPAYNTDGVGLFPRRIGEVQRLIGDSGFAVSSSWIRFTSHDFSRLPGILSDLLTWHACWLLEKPKPDHQPVG